jgi:hypothetical protein
LAKKYFLGLIKNVQMQGTPASVPQGGTTRRYAKPFVGNGLKPFSTGCTLQ